MKRIYSLLITELCCLPLFPQLLKDGNGNAIEWGQSTNHDGKCNPSYNMFCPENKRENTSCDKAAAGCGPVAVAQIMCMWQHPKESEYGTYDWSKIKGRLREGDSDDVPLFLRDVGKACDAHYQEFAGLYLPGTWSVKSDLINGFHKFQYSAMTAESSDWERDEFEELIRTEIDCGRPVLMYGEQSSFIYSHYYVIDGYDTKNKSRFHINWGWKGRNNRYCPLDTVYYNKEGEWITYPNKQAIIYAISPKKAGNAIRHTEGNKFIEQGKESSSVYYNVENANSWEVEVYESEDKVIWRGAGLTKDGKAYVWDGRNFDKERLKKNEYKLIVRLKNNNGEIYEFEDTAFNRDTPTLYELSDRNLTIYNFNHSISTAGVYSPFSACIKKRENCKQDDLIEFGFSSRGVYLLEIVKDGERIIEKVLVK